ncbi:hypothetical protein Hanom_Chr00s136064g01817251 [Helianthus anomalus]
MQHHAHTYITNQITHNSAPKTTHTTLHTPAHWHTQSNTHTYTHIHIHTHWHTHISMSTMYMHVHISKY